MSSAADHWRQSLDAWALPKGVLAGAEESPWIHPLELFMVPDVIESSPSHERAREALLKGGSVLDVGCGAGVAAFALTPPARLVIGVDQQSQMLAEFRANAEKRGVACETYEGSWPEVAEGTPSADVITAHHVVYNVGDIVPFLRSLDDHARARVVLEMPDHHPLSPMSAAWRHFWQLERPQGPTSSDLVDVLEEIGIGAHRQTWSGALRTEQNLGRTAHFMRIRLCLPHEREDEVREFLVAHPASPERALSTIWWDT
ncbi:MAG TPA: class I SAM-dependent methyltransferase [Acidimicrobiales bacterium]|nr:class I SAM-dependent methyltransferase [Acidimicrobiales bacterium]